MAPPVPPPEESPREKEPAEKEARLGHSFPSLALASFLFLVFEFASFFGWGAANKTWCFATIPRVVSLPPPPPAALSDVQHPVQKFDGAGRPSDVWYEGFISCKLWMD